MLQMDDCCHSPLPPSPPGRSPSLENMGQERRCRVCVGSSQWVSGWELHLADSPHYLAASCRLALSPVGWGRESWLWGTWLRATGRGPMTEGEEGHRTPLILTSHISLPSLEQTAWGVREADLQEPGYSTCPVAVSITWKLVRMQILKPLPRPADQNLCVNQSLSRVLCTYKFEGWSQACLITWVPVVLLP